MDRRSEASESLCRGTGSTGGPGVALTPTVDRGDNTPAGRAVKGWPPRRAHGAIHGEPDGARTAETLAPRAGLSRSAFCQRFASGCEPVGSETGIHDSYDLRDGTPLPVDDVEAARSVVDRTALPAAYWRGGYVFGTTVLLYPRALDPLDPASAEWLVVFSGGWLE